MNRRYPARGTLANGKTAVGELRRLFPHFLDIKFATSPCASVSLVIKEGLANNFLSFSFCLTHFAWVRLVS